jgi:hypothetical protein
LASLKDTHDNEDEEEDTLFKHEYIRELANRYTVLHNSMNWLTRLPIIIKTEIEKNRRSHDIADDLQARLEQEEEQKRKKQREENKLLFEKYLNNNEIYKAAKLKISSYEISPKFRYFFIQLLNSLNIQYIIAPFEADCELAYLSKINYVDFIITEDSDLIAYGCKCVLYKLNTEINNNEFGFEIKYENVKFCKNFDFSQFNYDQFLTYCILCGCDYFKLNGVGIGMAYLAVRNNVNYLQSLNFLLKKMSKLKLVIKKLLKCLKRRF